MNLILSAFLACLAFAHLALAPTAANEESPPRTLTRSYSFDRALPAPAQPGCTVYLTTDGSFVYWGGCPTVGCSPDECESAINAGGRHSCKCDGSVAAVLCQAWFIVNPDGTVGLPFNCIGVDCAKACDEEAIPAPPYPGGTVDFYACDCS